MPDTTEHSRLPRNFHRTFKPERRYLNALLRFAAAGGKGNVQEIASATGIPTGEHTGKVPAVLDYCRGMGLVDLAGPDRSAIKEPVLTAFGRIVLLEDPHLTQPVSQWVAHLNLCSPRTGADAWYQSFFAGTPSLGMSFERTQLEAHLSAVYGVDRAGLIGPLIGTYEDEAAFKVCGALAEDSGRIQRKKAPLVEEMALGYGAWLLGLIQVHFPGVRQVPVTTLDSAAGWRTIPGWDISDLQRVLDMLTRKGVIDVDRHMEPWLIAPACDHNAAWKRIYDDLL